MADQNRTTPPMSRTSAACRCAMAGFLLLAIVFQAACEREAIVPKPLIGQWKTNDPKYEDRALTFREHAVIYGFGAGVEVTHSIDNIDSTESNVGTVYILSYRNSDGQKETLRVTYRFGFNGEALQIEHTNAIWGKISARQTGR